MAGVKLQKWSGEEVLINSLEDALDELRKVTEHEELYLVKQAEDKEEAVLLMYGGVVKYGIEEFENSHIPRQSGCRFRGFLKDLLGHFALGIPQAAVDYIEKGMQEGVEHDELHFFVRCNLDPKLYEGLEKYVLGLSGSNKVVGGATAYKN